MEEDGFDSATFNKVWRLNLAEDEEGENSSGSYDGNVEKLLLPANRCHWQESWSDQERCQGSDTLSQGERNGEAVQVLSCGLSSGICGLWTCIYWVGSVLLVDDTCN